MNRYKVFRSILLVLVLFLAACQSRSDPGPTEARPTALAGATGPAAGSGEPTALASPTQAAPDTPAGTAEPGPSSAARATVAAATTPAQIAAPSATATAPPTEPSHPTATTTPAGPEIISFGVAPAEASPGETVTLTWTARGDRATLCPTAQYSLFTADDCRQVPLSGTTAYPIPPETAGFQYVDFVLQVEAGSPPATAAAQVRVAFKCERTWFFSDAPQAGICPLEPVYTSAAAQTFERGTMIWLEKPGGYYILGEAPLFEGDDRKWVDIVNDPLTITRDTSSEIDPPPGLYAPQSGFGLVWRGDVEGSPGYVESLGWAVKPEFGYQATLQCDDARPSGGRSWQTCYLQGPEGEVIVFHPLGGWLFWPEQ